MTTIEVREKLPVEPSYLKDNLGQHLYQKLKDKYIGKCTQNYGYVLSIGKKIKVYDNEISIANETIFFDIGFQVRSIKPVKNHVYMGTVCMVFEDGVFVEVEKYMKVLIPSDKMKPYQYNKREFQNPPEKSIVVGSQVSLEIERIKYEQKNFNCIGLLKI